MQGSFRGTGIHCRCRGRGVGWIEVRSHSEDHTLAQDPSGYWSSDVTGGVHRVLCGLDDGICGSLGSVHGDFSPTGSCYPVGFSVVVLS